MKFKHLKSYVRNFVNVVMKDPLRKSFASILTEYLSFLVSDPDTANQYFTKFLYRKGAPHHGRFVIPERILHKCWKMNDPKYHVAVADKLVFEHFFTRHHIPVVRSKAYNANYLFFWNNEIFTVDTPGDFLSFLERLFENNRSGLPLIVKRKFGSSGGASVFRINYDDLREERSKLDLIYNELTGSEYIFQDYIKQHPLVDIINPSCLNTVRMDSFTNKKGISRVYSAFLRMGLKDAHVDNVGSGGIYVAINLADGTLSSESWSDLSHGRAKTYLSHPDTGVRFEGRKIPFFDQAEALVIQAAELVPGLRLLGWDVAITREGPVILEANECPGITHSEVASGGFYDNEVIRDVLEELGEPVKTGNTRRRVRVA